MIYYIADLPANTDSLERNPVFNTIKNFELGDFDYQVLIPRFVPFLRYLGAEYEMYDGAHIVHVFDQIQDIQRVQGFPFTMDDLPLPPKTEPVYTRDQVLLYQGVKRTGQVTFNRFGFVKQVQSILETGTRVDTYSDRGFIASSQFKNQDDTIVRTELYNQDGETILTVDSDGVHVAQAKRSMFDHSNYPTMAALRAEFLNRVLQRFDTTRDYLIINIENEWLLDFAQHFSAPERLIFESIQSDQRLTVATATKYASLLDGRTIVTDSPLKAGALMKLEATAHVQQDIELLPTFLTDLNLGESNTLAESYLYWRIKTVDTKFKSLFWRMLKYRTKYTDLRLIMDLQSEDDQNVLEELVKRFVNEELQVDTGSDLFIMLQKYYKAAREHKLMQGQQKEFEAAQKQLSVFKKVDDAVHFLDNVSYRYKSSTLDLDQDLHFTRVFIDDHPQSDLFMQSRVVGAGIPIISREPSIYFTDGENGALIESNDALFNTLSTYLNGSREWNQALVASVDKINANGTDKLIESWRGILHGQKKK